MRANITKIFLVMLLCSIVGVAPVAAQLPGPNPQLSITASPFPLMINQNARITMVATNVGTANADNIVISNGVPNNMGIIGVATSQGGASVYNSAATIDIGTLAPGQSATVYMDVFVVQANPSDTPFNDCAGLTFYNGTARLSCLPRQSAINKTPRVSYSLPPNGARPIDNPNRGPILLPVAGGALIDSSAVLLVLGGVSIVLGRLLKRKRE
ncbi:MAG TPA: hypothetical protein VFF70_10235 [Anaerolineae bacterium]|nr:hypothetical protein [Anaerolineae bacterium]